MRLIDADEAIKRLGDAHFKNYGNAIMVIRETLPVDAIPIEFVQERIDHLHELAEYEFKYNGGYIGATHIAWHELEKILIEWKEERDANQDKTD